VNHQITEYNESIFERIKHINEFGQEYWLAQCQRYKTAEEPQEK